MATPGLTTDFEKCPVCWRSVELTHGVLRLYRRHSDGAGNYCPMSGNPVPEEGPDT